MAACRWPNSRQVHTLLCAIGVAILTAGCGDRGQEVSGGSDGPGEKAEFTPVGHRRGTSADSVSDAVIPHEALGLTSPARQAAVRGDNWQTEAFNEKAGAQLKALGKLLTVDPPVDPHKLSEIAGETYHSSRLRPSALDTVFEDTALRVRRATAAPVLETTGDPSFQGVRGLAQTLADLSQPLTGAAERRCKFKIFRVVVSDGEAETSAYFQLSGRTEVGVLQQTSVWDCRWEQSASDKPPVLTSISVTDYEESLGRKSDGPLFSDCTEAVIGQDPAYREHLIYGLDYWLDRIEMRYGIIATGYQGLAVGDVNGDGRDDVYVCQPGGAFGGLPNRLFLQNADGTASECAARSAVDWTIQSHGALLVDLDNDGDQDLVVATVLGLIFAANDGSGVFQIRAAKLTPEAPPISLAAADFDQDGDLDIYAACYSHRSSSEFMGRPIPYHDANNGGRNVLFRNDHNWRWTNVTKKVGLDQNNRRFSLACAWEDFDNDGDVDLYVANDYGRNNLYQNDDGRFRDIAAEAGVEDLSAGMSVSWGDYNRDGWMDLYVSNMWSSAGNRIAYQRQFLDAQADPSTLSGFQRHARGNSLFANMGPPASRFRDASLVAGVTMGRWAWSSGFMDVNNDGWEDLMIANGFITQENPDDL